MSNPFKNGEYQVLPKGTQILLHRWHLSCYLCYYKPSKGFNSGGHIWEKGTGLYFKSLIFYYQKINMHTLLVNVIFYRRWQTNRNELFSDPFNIASGTKDLLKIRCLLQNINKVWRKLLYRSCSSQHKRLSIQLC